jgi:hypothetical protein
MNYPHMNKNKEEKLDDLVKGGQKVIDSAVIALACIAGSAVILIAGIIIDKI